MERNHSLTLEEQDNLRIVDYLDMQKLPELLQQMLSLATTPEEKDILLMSTLAGAGACAPYLYFRYGPTGKKYYANLQCFILAASASGKGIANQALDMVRVVDEQYPLLIAGDSTLPAWYMALEEQGGIGYMHESEGSVITDIWKTSAANYNTALRKAAEHEPISRNRVKGSSEIRNPRLSMLLTGTFNQYRTLVPSVENGYFSRLLTLVERGSHPFEKRYVTASGTHSAIPRQVGRQLLRAFEASLNSPEREWSLTASQKERLGTHLETTYSTLINLLGDNFHSVVLRMAVQIERIAMVLTAMRGPSSITSELYSDKTILCADSDFESAELIGNKLLLHMANAYRMIEGDKQDLIPDTKPLDPRRVLFDQLKPEYKLQELISEAKAQGISRATVIRWNDAWQEQGQVLKIEYGHYRKAC